NLLTGLFRHERIETTEAKAKAVRGLADHVITLAKRENLHARRQVLSLVPDTEVVGRIFDTIAARFTDRNGGYTPIIKSRGSRARGAGGAGRASRDGGGGRQEGGQEGEGAPGREGRGGRRRQAPAARKGGGRGRLAAHRGGEASQQRVRRARARARLRQEERG